MTPLQRQLVCEAESWMGTVEVPKGSNGGGRVAELLEYYFGDAAPRAWCTVFVWNVIDRAVRKLGGVHSVPGASMVGGNAKRTYEIAARKYRTDTTPAVGSMFFRTTTDPSDTAHSGHMGIVVGWDGEKLLTIEGNQGESDKVDRYRYEADTLAGWGFRFVHVEETPVRSVDAVGCPESVVEAIAVDDGGFPWGLLLVVGIVGVVVWKTM